MILSCNKSERVSIKFEQQEINLLQSLSQETSFALAYSMNDMTNVFRLSSIEELDNLDIKQFSNKSILAYSSQSEFLSPQIEIIESVLNYNRSRDYNIVARRGGAKI